MKKGIIPALTLIGAGLVALTTLAQPPEEGDKPADRPPREEMRERMLKEFDADNDGKLSDEERHKARESMRERFGPRHRDSDREGEPHGKDGKGPRRGHGPEGRDGFRGPRPGGPEGGPPPRMLEHLFNRFDEDSDDSLSRDEFAKLSEFVRSHRPGPPGGSPQGPRFGRRGPDGPPPGDGEFRRRRGPDGPPFFDGPPPRRPRDERRGDEPDRLGPPGPDHPPGPPPELGDNPDEAI
jgi:hypothetical protein